MSALRLSRNGLLNGQAVTELVRGIYGPIIDGQVEAVESILARTKEKTAEIDRSMDLTVAGRVSQKKALGVKVLEELNEPINRRRERINSDLEKAKLDLPMKLPTDRFSKVHPAAFETRASEIRKALLDANPLVRQTMIKGAAESGDLELLMAVQQAPKILQESLLAGLDFDLVVQTFLEKANPEQFEAINAIGQALDLFDSNARTARKVATGLTGASNDPPVGAE